MFSRRRALDKGVYDCVHDKARTTIQPRSGCTPKPRIQDPSTTQNPGCAARPTDGSGTIWTEELIHYTTEEGESRDDMQNMGLIGPHTILVIDQMKDGHAFGIPVTVRKKQQAK